MQAIKILVLCIALMLMADALQAQCPMCKTALVKARESGETQVGNTLNDGILYLFAFPYIVAGVFGYIYYKKYKQHKASKAI
jgi:uncharacterized paraquat-inducible protein A